MKVVNSPSQAAAPVRLRVLDLFSGLEGWSRPFRDRGHEVVTLDASAKFGADFARDILSVKSLHELEGGGGPFDVVLASPPCETFSLLTVWRHWQPDGKGGYRVVTDKGRQGLKVMRHTFKLISDYQPRFYVVENPRAMMRHAAPRRPATTVWYCRLGERRAKPTDLWTNLPVRFPGQCRYRHPDHEAVPSGSRGGTIGLKSSADRALIPYGLGLTVALAAEYELGADRKAA